MEIARNVVVKVVLDMSFLQAWLTKRNIQSTIHTAIREKVRDNAYLATTHMAVKYNKKKGVF